MYRLEFYKMFEDIIGRLMTEEEHKKLKTLMQGYLEDHTVHVPVHQAIDYTFTCRNCKKTEVGAGKDFRQKMLKQDRNAMVVSSTSSKSATPKKPVVSL